MKLHIYENKTKKFKKVSISEASVCRLCMSPTVVLTPMTIMRHFQPCSLPEIASPSPQHCYKCCKFVKTNSYALYN